MADEQFNFGANKTEVEDELRVPVLDVPFLGDAYLQDVRIDNELGEDNYRVLIQEFVCLPPNEAGPSMKTSKRHRIVYWEPDESDTIPGDDGIAPLQRMLDRIAYRLKYWFEDDEDMSREEKAAEVVQMKGSSRAEAWDNLRNRIVETMDDKVPGDPIEDPRDQDEYKIVRIKVLGNVYFSNKQQRQVADLQMPGYKGTISDSNSDYPVSLSPQEQDNNNEWMEFKSSTPTSNEEVDTEDEDYSF